MMLSLLPNSGGMMSVGVLTKEYSFGINFSFPIACLKSEHPELRKLNNIINTNILNFLKSKIKLNIFLTP